MKRLLITFLALSGMASGSLLYAEVAYTASAAQPDGAFPISSTGAVLANNICKWHPAHAPGSQRELGQRIVTGRTPQTVNRFVLKLAEIQSAVGPDARGSEFTFRIVRFESHNAITPLSDAVLNITGRLPSDLATGDYLIIDFPDVELEPSTTYGLEVGFHEAGESRSLNFETTDRGSYQQGRIYFRTNEPDANQLIYVLRSGNLRFFLGSK